MAEANTAQEGDVRSKFRKVLQKAEKLGITADQIGKLNSVECLRRQQKPWFGWLQSHARIFIIGLTICQACLFTTWMADFPVAKKSLVRLWFAWDGFDIEAEPCLITVGEGLVDISRPPADCGICRGLQSIDRVSKITQLEFEDKYAYKGRPVVITDAAVDWTAIQTFSFNFFKEIYAEDSPALINLDHQCQFFPYKTNFGSLAEVFNMSDERASMKDGSEPWYIGWSNCDSSAANILRKHYERPYFLPAVAESSKTDWIFMGSPGYGAHMHIDNVGNPSWQAQITGTKRWALEPPPECYQECAQRIEVIVSPGEIIVLDTNQWFHSTLILGSDMSITIGSEYD